MRGGHAPYNKGSVNVHTHADAMARMAAHRSNQDLAAKEKYHADAMARMAAPREVPREVW